MLWQTICQSAYLHQPGRGSKVVEFVKEIMYKFGVHNNIIIDNGTRFTTREFKDFSADSNIKINYDSVSHP
jgi:hypothetical protein